MAAGIYNFTIDQGSDLTLPIEIKNDDDSVFDLTDYTARMQIRQYVNSTSTEDELTTANGRITISQPSTYYVISLIFPNATTEAYTFNTAVYDLEIIDSSSTVTRILQGKITLSKEVTR